MPSGSVLLKLAGLGCRQIMEGHNPSGSDAKQHAG